MNWPSSNISHVFENKNSTFVGPESSLDKINGELTDNLEIM